MSQSSLIWIFTLFSNSSPWGTCFEALHAHSVKTVQIKNNILFEEFLGQQMNSVSAKDGAYKGDLDMNKLGKYKYFKMTIYDNDWEDGFDKPVTRYFKY